MKKRTPEQTQKLINLIERQVHKIFRRKNIAAHSFIVGYNADSIFITLYIHVWLTPTETERLYVVDTLHSYFNVHVLVVPLYNTPIRRFVKDFHLYIYSEYPKYVPRKRFRFKPLTMPKFIARLFRSE